MHAILAQVDHQPFYKEMLARLGYEHVYARRGRSVPLIDGDGFAEGAKQHTAHAKKRSSVVLQKRRKQR